MRLHRKHLWIYLAGILLVSGIGIWLTLKQGRRIVWTSYNVPFLFQKGGDPHTVIITIDPDAKKRLNQPTDAPLGRQFYTQLVKRLHADGARLILFDLISFDESHPDPLVDRDFAAAAKAHGGVVLVTMSVRDEQLTVDAQRLIPIIPEIHHAVIWGLANADADDDGMIRRIYGGTLDTPTATWAAAKHLGAKVTQVEENRFDERWLNYYGPPGTFRRVFIDHALAEEGLEKGFFKDKLVFIGFGSDIGTAGSVQDTFPNPHSQLGAAARWTSTGETPSRWSFGVEVMALSTLNLFRGDWIVRLKPTYEDGLIIIWGLVSVLLFSSVRPWTAAGLGAIAIVGFFSVGILSQLKLHVWWSWLILVAQTPVALVWSIGYSYLIESRKRRHLIRAFAGYSSPYMAEQIAESDFDPTPGGVNVEATIMFTDLEGFTKLSESLPSDEVSKILISYFTQTTESIFEQRGMIIKYIGDAVLAVWGAALPDPEQAERAVLAAWAMSQSSKRPVEGRILRTRIGLNTGTVLAGNLGSPKRFDYTVIGDPVNFASRLEGLNKYLGTDILISEATRGKLSDAIKVRSLGRFRVVGKKLSVGIFEVIGLAGSFDDKQEWIATFDQALRCFTEQRFDEAEMLFRKTMELRGGVDGPSEFYLHEIPKMRGTVGEDWDGSVLIEGK